jgi:hypothetical protein
MCSVPSQANCEQKRFCACLCHAGILKTLVTVALRNAVRGRPVSDLPGDISLLHRLFFLLLMQCTSHASIGNASVIGLLVVSVSCQERRGRWIQVPQRGIRSSDRRHRGVPRGFTFGSPAALRNFASASHSIGPEFDAPWRDLAACVRSAQLHAMPGMTAEQSVRCGRHRGRQWFCSALPHQAQKGVP